MAEQLLPRIPQPTVVMTTLRLKLQVHAKVSLGPPGSVLGLERYRY